MSLSLISTRPEDFSARVVVPLPRPGRTTVDVVVPVHNGEHDLAPRIRRLHAFLEDEFPFTSRITIADSASTDGTAAIADRLRSTLAGVRVLHLNEKGRGRALAAAWMTSEARVLAYMHAGHTTDFTALVPLVAPILSGNSDLCIGSPRSEGALFPRVYDVLLRRGLKAVRADVARRLVPEVIDRSWLFDTELLVRAERAGMRIREVPVGRLS